MTNNSQSNEIIKWVIIVADFIILNALLVAFMKWHPKMALWAADSRHVFFLASNLAMVISESWFYTVIHRRLVSSAEILRRIVLLTMAQTVLAYMFVKLLQYNLAVVKILLVLGTALFVAILIARILERLMVRAYRRSGKNMRTVVLVGSDPELMNLYKRLMRDASRGYRVIGYYSDEVMEDAKDKFKWLGTIDELLAKKHNQEMQTQIDDMYVCLSRRKPEIIRQISRVCEENVIRFYFVPVSVETIGLPLKRELVDDMEVYSLYRNPLRDPKNKLVKRVFDIVFSIFAIVCFLPFLPIIALIIKIQSPKGGVFFRQPRTGADGKNFLCVKFRSMHPNKDESGLVQATKDDPRKFPFGNLMRKTSIDELPQFWNVLKGDMSIVGPRPHPVALNEEYVKLIDKYMVRHYVKPGVTGWAQVTGFRGETEELWQMEGRVKRDIWYMENWSFWLDLRIIWLTIRQILLKDEQAY